MRFRGTLIYTLEYRTKIRSLSKSFVISQVPYETLPGFATERISYQTSQGTVVKRFRTKLFFSDLIYKRDHCAPNRSSSHFNRSCLHLYIIQFAILFGYFITALAYIIFHARPFLGAANPKKSVPLKTHRHYETPGGLSIIKRVNMFRITDATVDNWSLVLMYFWHPKLFHTFGKT